MGIYKKKEMRLLLKILILLTIPLTIVGNCGHRSNNKFFTSLDSIQRYYKLEEPIELIADRSNIISLPENDEAESLFKEYIDNCRYYLKTSSLDSVKIYYRIAQSINDHFKSKLFEADILEIQGSIYLINGEYSKAKNSLDESIRLRKTYNDDRYYNSSYAYNRLGTYHFRKGKFDSSLFYYKKALELAKLKGINGKSEIPSYTQNIGLVNLVIGKMSKAKKYLNEALILKNEIYEQDDPLFRNLIF
jgi:tetratricopeptide (TPR) repeat protein